MALFLGISFVSILECLFYGIHSIVECCCSGCCLTDDNQVDDDQDLPKWQQTQQISIRPSENGNASTILSRGNRFYDN